MQKKKEQKQKKEPYYIHVDSGVTISAADYKRLTKDHKAQFEIDDSEAQDGPHHQLSEFYNDAGRSEDTSIFAMLEKKGGNDSDEMHED
jgi:hypothetical protein